MSIRRVSDLSTRVALAATTLAAVAAAPRPAAAHPVMLQWFETRWETMEKKIPDAWVAGYSAIWFPPPSLADTGGFSVGYDVYDRFNFGTPFNQTLYGTDTALRQMIRTAHRADQLVYPDFVANHQGFRNQGTPGFDAAGGYPGFVLSVPGDADGDFHGAFESGDLTERLAGLIDIAQEKNYVYIRQPIGPGAQNIPRQTPNANNARYYPDQALTANGLGIKPFNLANPLAGDPVAENATGLLLRYQQYLIESLGADGLRIDAVKHMPTFYFNPFFDNTMFQRGRPDKAGNPTTPFSFGEAFTGDFGVLNNYTRKDGFGNRDVLDFPLKFALDAVFGGNGFGDMRNLEFASYDGADGNANDGTRGVTFFRSHDQGPSNNDNVAMAHVLTRAGYPVVYYNAKEFGNGRDFPKDGRGDALGGDFGDLPKRLTNVARRYAKGAHRTRSIDADVYVYERSNSLLVGISDRADSGFDSRTVDTDFGANAVLVELTGQATDPVVNANGDFPASITTDGSGRATIRVPRNSTNASYHSRGLIMYGPAAPVQVATLSPVASVLAPESTATLNGARRLTPLQVITSTSFSVTVTIPPSSPAVPNDNALIKFDAGQPFGTNPGYQTTGEFAGFQEFTSIKSPTPGNTTGTYVQVYDTTTMTEGLHFLETVAFRQRTGGAPAVYSSSRLPIVIDRVPPPISLVAPSTGGTTDVASQNVTVVASCPDFTADTMHFFVDKAVGYDPVVAGDVTVSNRMNRVDRNEFQFGWTPGLSGPRFITLVAFEQSGRYNVVRFGPIGVSIPQPPVFIGQDTDVSGGGVNFQPLPGSINTREFVNELVVRVQTTSSPANLSWPADFDVWLDIDGVTYPANPFDANLANRVNRLVQNDQNFGDGFDEFRLLWRGYGPNNHVITARTKLKNLGVMPENTASATVNVPFATTGPPCSITTPAGLPTLTNPTAIPVTVVTDGTARSVSTYLGLLNGTEQLLGLVNNPGNPAAVNFAGAVGSYREQDVISGTPVENGTYVVRAVAATGLDGAGLSGQAASTVIINGLRPFPSRDLPAADGNIRDSATSRPLAVSPVDGGGSGGTGADFGADGSLTELYARIGDGKLFLAVRGDLFNGANPAANQTIVYIDTNSTAGAGARNFIPGTSFLSDTGDNATRRRVSLSGFQVANVPANTGVGFDAAVAVDSRTPFVAKVFGFGSGGVIGSPSNMAELDGAVAFGTGFGTVPRATGTTVNGPTGFEVAIPLASLGNPDVRNMAFAVVTTSDDSSPSNPFPSPNTLPENASNAFDATQSIDTVARFPAAAPLKLNEIGNGTSDFAELFNPTGAAVDLTSWTLRWADAASAPVHVPLTGLSIPAGGHRWVIDTATTAAPAAALAIASNIPWDPSRAGSATLIDPYGIAVDYVRWFSQSAQFFADDAPAGTTFVGWVNGFDGKTLGAANARSLSRDSASIDTDTSADWIVRPPTPNAANTTSGVGKDWSVY